jgi:hypothetical protein
MNFLNYLFRFGTGINNARKHKIIILYFKYSNAGKFKLYDIFIFN